MNKFQDVERGVEKIVRSGVDEIFDECFKMLGNPDWDGGAEEAFLELIADTIRQEISEY